jgi:L-fuculose-phosphate aldolase
MNNIVKGQESQLREQMLETARKLNDLGLNRGTSGNLSVRLTESQWLVTPSGVNAVNLTTQAMVLMSFEGQVIGPGRPSSEWRFHQDILATRPEVNAVIHTHSTFATAMSCVQKNVPAFHYMIAAAGGDSIRCAPYALFGTQELSEYAVSALIDRMACLLSNHGMIAIGKNLTAALALAVEVESLCEQYSTAMRLGEPQLLTTAQMHAVLEQFKTYGASNQNS